MQGKKSQGLQTGAGGAKSSQGYLINIHKITMGDFFTAKQVQWLHWKKEEKKNQWQLETKIVDFQASWNFDVGQVMRGVSTKSQVAKRSWFQGQIFQNNYSGQQQVLIGDGFTSTEMYFWHWFPSQSFLFLGFFFPWSTVVLGGKNCGQAFKRWLDMNLQIAVSNQSVWRPVSSPFLRCFW